MKSRKNCKSTIACLDERENAVVATGTLESENCVRSDTGMFTSSCRQGDDLIITEQKSKLTGDSDMEARKWYMCGSCGKKFRIIGQLHNHFVGKHSCGSYHYDHFIRTAFPKYDTVCVGTQTQYIVQEKTKQPKKRKLKVKQVPDKTCRVEDDNGCITESVFASVKKYDEKENDRCDIIVTGSAYECIDHDNDDTMQMDDFHAGGTDDDLDNDEKFSTTGLTDKVLNGTESVPKTDDCDRPNQNTNKSDGRDNLIRDAKFKSKNNERKINADNSSHKKSNVRMSGVKRRCKKQPKTKDIGNGLAPSSEGTSACPNAGVVKHEVSSEAELLSNSMTGQALDDTTTGQALDDTTTGQALDDTTTDQASDTGCKCSICGAVFSFQRGLLRHEQMKHSAEMKFECEICKHKFMREYNLQKHIKCVHTIGKSHKNSVRHRTKDGDVMSGVNSESVGSKIEDGEDERKDIDVEKSPTKKSEDLSGKLPHTCEICGYTMPRSKMDVHRRLHTGERPYVCNLCGKGLISQKKLTRHLLIHSEVKKHTCDTCGAGFQMKYKLRMHQHIHTGKKPYLCSICGAEFNHSSNLATHTRCVHLQIKPFVCTKCGGRYAKRSQLDDHLLSHTEEKQYTCRYCGKSFKHYKGMRRHEKTHTEEKSFRCDKCDCTFSGQASLDQHMETHNTQKYPCQKCGKEFEDRKLLIEHESTHQKVKPFQCKLCKERYQLAHQYYTHMLAAHNIEKEEASAMHSENLTPPCIRSEADKQASSAQIDTSLPLLYESGSMPDLSVSSASTKGTNKIIPSLSVSQVVSGIIEENRLQISALTRTATENLRLHSEDVRDDEKLNIVLPGVNPLIERGQDISIVAMPGQNVVMETNGPMGALGFHPDGPMRALAHLSHVSQVLHSDQHQISQESMSSIAMGHPPPGDRMQLSHDTQAINPSVLLVNENLRVPQNLAVSTAGPIMLDARFKESGNIALAQSQAAGDFMCVREGWWTRRDNANHSEGTSTSGPGNSASWDHPEGNC